MLDYTGLTKLIGQRFIQRRDVKSFQQADGAWFPPKCPECRQASDNRACLHYPMTMEDFRNHLDGKTTMGHYLVNPETQTCKLFAFDLDVRKPNPDKGYQPIDGNGNPFNPREVWIGQPSPLRDYLVTQVRVLAEGIALRAHNTLGVHVAIADSGGKGMHVYCFTGEIPAEAAKEMAARLLGDWCFTASKGHNFYRHNDALEFPDVEIETFPKQSNVSAGGMGNLMKLPLGVNRPTGRKARFITTRSGLTEIVEMDPVKALEGDLPWE